MHFVCLFSFSLYLPNPCSLMENGSKSGCFSPRPKGGVPARLAGERGQG